MKCEIFQQSCSLFPIFLSRYKRAGVNIAQVMRKVVHLWRTSPGDATVFSPINRHVLAAILQHAFRTCISHIHISHMVYYKYGSFCLLAVHMNSPKKIREGIMKSVEDVYNVKTCSWSFNLRKDFIEITRIVMNKNHLNWRILCLTCIHKLGQKTMTGNEIDRHRNQFQVVPREFSPSEVIFCSAEMITSHIVILM